MKLGTIKSINDWNSKKIKQIHARSPQLKHQKKVGNMFKVNNKDTRTTLLNSFWCLYSQPYIFYTLFYCLYCRFWAGKCYLGTGVMHTIYHSAEDVIALRPILLILVFVILLLILSIFIIAGFDTSYFSRF